MKYFHAKADALCRNYGYRIIQEGENYRVKECAIRGYTAESIVPIIFKSILGCMDYLCPIIKDNRFTAQIAHFEGK